MTLVRHIHVIGCGLIGSSLCHIINQKNLCEKLSIYDADPAHRDMIKDLYLAPFISEDVTEYVDQADLIILATPIGSFSELIAAIAPHLKEGAILTDVGSVKNSVVETIEQHLPKSVSFIAGHPIAGTEFSGPKAGFAELFENRWIVLTPSEHTSDETVEKVQSLWQAGGAKIKMMTPKEHDLVLALTSHLPHMIAYTIVGTAVNLEEDMKKDVLELSAGGFRDFTRIAASDPTMWRDIFLQNKDAVLEVLGRFEEDLSNLRRAIRRQEGDALFNHFKETRKIRQEILDRNQL